MLTSTSSPINSDIRQVTHLLLTPVFSSVKQKNRLDNHQNISSSLNKDEIKLEDPNLFIKCLKHLFYLVFLLISCFSTSFLSSSFFYYVCLIFSFMVLFLPPLPLCPTIRSVNWALPKLPSSFLETVIPY